MNLADRIKLLDDAPKSRGKSCLSDHYHGERLTQRRAIIAKCCDCMGYNADGRMDCRMPHCSLYPWMPFRDDRAERKRADLAHKTAPTHPPGSTIPPAA